MKLMVGWLRISWCVLRVTPPGIPVTIENSSVDNQESLETAWRDS